MGKYFRIVTVCQFDCNIRRDGTYFSTQIALPALYHHDNGPTVAVINQLCRAYFDLQAYCAPETSRHLQFYACTAW
ncbi:hypothetical protein ACQRIT_006850 [Beauveria bassiana]